MWNNTCGSAEHPVNPTRLGTAKTGGRGGTVTPNDGSGHIIPPPPFGGSGPFIPGYQWVPFFQGTHSTDFWPGTSTFTTITFNFGASDFVGKLPTGYAAWDDTSGDTSPCPGPACGQTINVANAPVYSNGATMTQGNVATHTLASRIVGGPGCNTSGFTNGSNCWLWQALNGGTLSRAGNPAANWMCPSPVNTGGIYATSFPGASTVIDNGVTFACLVRVDYTTLTAAFNDGEGDWAPRTDYSYGAVVRHGGLSYINLMPMSAFPWICTSGATFAVPSDGGCATWVRLATIQFTSKTNQWPHQLCARLDGRFWRLWRY